MRRPSYRSHRGFCLATVITAVAVGTSVAQPPGNMAPSSGPVFNGDIQLTVHRQAVIGYILSAARTQDQLRRVYYSRHIGVRQAADGKPWFQVDRGTDGEGDPVVRFTVDLPPDLPADKVEEAKKKLGDDSALSLIRMPVVRYVVTIECDGQSDEVMRDSINGGDLGSVIHISHPVKNEALKKRLVANPAAVIVRVQVWSELQKEAVAGVAVSRYSQQCTDYVERLTSKRDPDQQVILTQNGMRNLQLFLQATVAAVIYGQVSTPAEFANELVANALKDSTVVLKEGSYEQMQAWGIQQVVLGNDILRLNLTPTEVKVLRTKFEEWGKAEGEAETAWDKMAEIVRLSTSASDLSTRVTEEATQNPKFAATVGFMGVGGRAGGGGGGSQRTERAYRFSQSEYDALKKVDRNWGLEKSKYLNEFKRAWEGESFFRELRSKLPDEFKLVHFGKLASRTELKLIDVKPIGVVRVPNEMSFLARDPATHPAEPAEPELIAFGSINYPGYEDQRDPIRGPHPELSSGTRNRGIAGQIVAVRTGNTVKAKRGNTEVEVPDIAVLVPCTEAVIRRIIDPNQPLVTISDGVPRPIEKVDPKRLCLSFCKDGVAVVCSAPNTRYITIFPHVAYYEGTPYLAFQARRLPWGFLQPSDEKFSFTFEVRDFNNRR